jgi:hypothetical protein
MGYFVTSTASIWERDILRGRPLLTATPETAPSQVHAKYPLDDENHQAEQAQHGQVRGEERENAIHKPFLWANQPQYGNAAD